MKILVCGERFLSRFGADRVLLLFGQRLKTLGHQVVLLGLRFDEDSRGMFGPDIVSLPGDASSYIDLDEHTGTWMRAHWDELFAADPPKLAIVGGWPFYHALPFLRERCPVLAMDFGAVPLDGLSGGTLEIQQKLRGLRTRYLESASLILANSRFTAESQSGPDSHGRVPIASLLVGADHMDEAMWGRGDPEAGASSALTGIATLHREGKRALLALGRWEPVGYKNSEAALDLLRRLRSRVPGTVLFVLASRDDVTVPDDLVGAVFPLGFPSDRELRDLMAAADLGVSVSRWEGFNLPLAEMQWLGRPVLAFDLGAHPEVIADPWYLCRDLAEMTEKAARLLSTGPAAPVLPAEALDRFRHHFRWERAFREFLGLLAPFTGSRTLLGHARVIVDVTNAARDPANTGVIRVTRRLGETLQHVARPVFVVWDESSSRYVFPTADEFAVLGRFNGPIATDDHPKSPASGRLALDDRLSELRRGGPCCLLLTETVPAARAEAARDFASDRGIPLAAIFYDAIPVLYPELCPDPLVRDNHDAYMRQLAACDLVLPISRFSADCLQEHWNRLGLPGGEVLPLPLPGELGQEPRLQRVDERASAGLRILCVSTLEPRKNHAALLAACRLLDERFPNLTWSLTLVGNRYAGAFDIAEMIEEACRRDRRIAWRGIVDDGALAKLYREATFTVYPSLVEGFGMPVMESLWYGAPCICRNEGVMAELAAGGGCLTVDVTDPVALCDAIGRLATDERLRHELAEEATRRPIATWLEYGTEVAAGLAAHCAQSAVAPSQSPPAACRSEPEWTQVVYPGSLLADWQQEHPVRLAIAAVLARQRPRCAVEIGTSRGGSLSLIRQYADLVFSVDIDPAAADSFRHFSNVSLLTGPSAAILPVLFRELDGAAIPVGFILVDGDRSEAGVAQDIACILDYVPKCPLFVMLHDSFHPQCRRGMLTAQWRHCPYVQWVDIDFVPGHVVEDGGPFHGQLRGGLAMAYLTAVPRTGDLVVHASAATMFEKLYRVQHTDG